MKKEKKEFSRSAKRVAALAIMFTIGVSAFAESRGNGLLFQQGKNNLDAINDNAVTDYLEVKDFIRDASADKKWTDEEIEIGNFLTNKFEENYGKGSLNLISQAEKENAENVDLSSPLFDTYATITCTGSVTKESRKDVATAAVKTAARHQREQIRQQTKYSEIER